MAGDLGGKPGLHGRIGAVIRALLAVAAAGALWTMTAGEAAAKPGDVWVADLGAVLRVDPAGQVHKVAGGPPLVSPSGLAFAPDGALLVADEGADKVFRVTREGEVSEFASGKPLDFPFGIDVSPSGTAFVADAQGPRVNGLILKLEGGKAVPFSSGAPFSDFTYGLEIAPSGTLFAADAEAGVLRINGSTGSAGVLSALPPLVDPAGLARAPDGTLYVTDYTFNGVIRVSRFGRTTPVVSSPLLSRTFDADVLPSGKLVVANVPELDGTGVGALYRVDPESGAVQLLAKKGIAFPYGVAVEPPSCGGRSATLPGTNLENAFAGSPFADVAALLRGDDRFNGMGGRDVVCGGAGNDRLVGGKGPDRLIGGKGRDICIGGPGPEKYKGCETKR